MHCDGCGWQGHAAHAVPAHDAGGVEPRAAVLHRGSAHRGRVGAIHGAAARRAADAVQREEPHDGREAAADYGAGLCCAQGVLPASQHRLQVGMCVCVCFWS